MANPMFWHLLLVSTIQVGAAIDWTSSGIPNRSTLRACLGEKVTFPWNFELLPGEQTINVEWYRSTGKKEAMLAVLVHQNFFTPSSVQESKVTYIPGAGIEIPRVNWTDFGTYTVKVNYNNNGSLLSSEQTAFLTMQDSPVLADGRLVANVRPEPILDSTTGRLHVQLTCGHFLTVGSRPVAVAWMTPSGQKVPSTSFDNGEFLLNLPHPTEGGGYTCHLEDPSLAARCMRDVSHLRQGAYVRVDEVQTRLLLLEGGVQQLQHVDEKLDSELDRQAEDIEDQYRNITSEMDRLAKITETLLARTEEVVADNAMLKTQTEELKSANENLTSANGRLEFQLQRLASDMSEEKALVEGLTTQMNSVNAEVNSLKSRTGKRVAFLARLSEANVQANIPVLFKAVVFNMGSAFDPNTGVFTITHAGVYIISFQMFPTYGGDVLVDLYKNGNIEVRMRVYDVSWSTSEASSVTQHCQPRDRYWVQVHRGGRMHFGVHSFFSASLISADE